LTAPCGTPLIQPNPLIFQKRHAFRHAEDVNGPPTALTPIGTKHANLYIEMITSLEVTQNYCPVAAVYAVNPIKPDGSVGTKS
jgi:hypothetical protein